ncbi:MAG: rRNA pseudouridine synthase [Candidatus Aenigmarchaeota archaeon]|nr:rRNA pseudouridine synthase [Candidatus Aenigmarchaeota archaeon]
MSKKIRLRALLMRSGEFERSAIVEQAIRNGEVTVDGKVITNPEHSIKIKSMVKYNGGQVKAQELIYIILNKQTGRVCQKSTKEKTIYDDIAKIPEIDDKIKNTLFCVGRLDKDTEGLLVVTNDGQLEKLLTKKENRIIKTYRIEAMNPITDENIETLEEGVNITDDDKEKIFFVKAIATKKLGTRKIEMEIDEGKKRQIKKMFQAIGNEVVSLKRVGIGNLRIENVNFNEKNYVIINKSDLKLPKFTS